MIHEHVVRGVLNLRTRNRTIYDLIEFVNTHGLTTIHSVYPGLYDNPKPTVVLYHPTVEYFLLHFAELAKNHVGGLVNYN